MGWDEKLWWLNNGDIDEEFARSVPPPPLHGPPIMAEVLISDPKTHVLTSDPMGPAILTPAGAAFFAFGKKAGVRGEVWTVLGEAGKRIIHEATVQKKGWDVARKTGILFEFQQAATFNVNALEKGSDLRAFVTANNHPVNDLVVKNIKNSKVVTGAQLKSGSSASNTIKRAMKKVVPALQHIVPKNIVVPGIQHTLTAVADKGSKAISSKPIDQHSLNKMTAAANQGKNPLTAVTKRAAGAMKTAGTVLKLAGKVCFVAGALWSVTSNVIDVYNGEKKVGRAIVCVALDVSGVQLALDLYALTKKAVGNN